MRPAAATTRVERCLGTYARRDFSGTRHTLSFDVIMVMVGDVLKGIREKEGGFGGHTRKKKCTQMKKGTGFQKQLSGHTLAARRCRPSHRSKTMSRCNAVMLSYVCMMR